jgi:dihydrofolate reductase
LDGYSQDTRKFLKGFFLRMINAKTREGAKGSIREAAFLKGKVEIVSGPLRDVVKELSMRSLTDLYIDGGKLIQSFLAEDMVDELIVTQVPVLLGGGTPLYGSLPKHLEFELVTSEVLLHALVQSHYRRQRR